MSDFRPHTVYIAADHAGFDAKQIIVKALEGEFTITDLGAPALDPTDDFTPYAERTARKVVSDPGSLGILVCGSGEGMAMAANKIDGVRASVAWNPEVAHETRDDNDANIVALPARFDSVEELVKIAHTFLTTPFSRAERHQRRVDQIKDLEQTS